MKYALPYPSGTESLWTAVHFTDICTDIICIDPVDIEHCIESHEV